MNLYLVLNVLLMRVQSSVLRPSATALSIRTAYLYYYASSHSLDRKIQDSYLAMCVVSVLLCCKSAGGSLVEPVCRAPVISGVVSLT